MRTMRRGGLLATLAAGLGLAALLAGRLGLLSGSRPEGLGVHEGRLAPVREHLDNSVSSFASAERHRIAPLATGADPRATFDRLERIVASSPGATIVASSPGYLQAEFETQWLRFVDDVEFLLDEPARAIHVRSASRLGRRDFGVNRRRIESIRARLAQSESGQH